MGSHASTSGRSLKPSPARDDEVRAILDELRRIVQGLRAASIAAERRFGLSGAQLFVLLRLRGEDSLSINELAARTLTHQSSVSVVVTRLVDKGLVTRARSAADARRVELKLTRRGRDVLRRAPRATQERLIGAIATMPPARRRSLTSGLRLLNRAIAVDGRAPRMLFEEEAKRDAQT
ncbi:MAG: hypothetical protein NVS3B10_21290 [Polyangiales bacterium]